MMSQAYYTGLSGIKASQSAIDVISDNLANTSTIGFRSYSSEFSNIFEQTTHTSSGTSSVNSSIGVGSTMSSTTMNENKGVFQLSDLSTDLALLGDGWFGIQGEEEPLYTRNGSFTFDANRALVTHDGYYALGTMGSNINGSTLTSQLANVDLGDIDTQEKLIFPENLAIAVQPTTTAVFSGNLGSEDVVRVISAEVIDAQNNRNDLRLQFTKSAVQPAQGSSWDIIATVESRDGLITYGTENGVVNFNDDGSLQSTTISSIDNNGSTVSIDLGSSFTGVVSNNNTFSGSSQTDGLSSGDLFGYDINKNGEVIATFSNGLQSAVGRVAVYHFQNDRGLERVSGSRFQESSNSGKAIFFQDENGNNIIGTDITNFKLEGSNVRMEVGLTEIIVMQRAFDANSKSITTADQMLQKALNMDA